MIVALIAILGFAAADTPRDEYRTLYSGTYAEKSCADASQLWVFSDGEVTAGRLACDVRDVARRGDGALTVTTRACTEAGKTVAAPSYVLEVMSTDTVKVRTSGRVVMLRRCQGM